MNQYPSGSNVIYGLWRVKATLWTPVNASRSLWRRSSCTFWTPSSLILDTRSAFPAFHTPTLWSVVEHNDYSSSQTFWIPRLRETPSVQDRPTRTALHQTHFGHASRPSPCGQHNKPGNRPTPILWSAVEHNVFQFCIYSGHSGSSFCISSIHNFSCFPLPHSRASDSDTLECR